MVRVETLVGKLASLESERDMLDKQIKKIREELVERMEVGESVPVEDGKSLMKLSKTTWKIEPVAVYEEVGPRKFLSYVNSVSIPLVRKNLGEVWMKKNGSFSETEYVSWKNGSDKE